MPGATVKPADDEPSAPTRGVEGPMAEQEAVFALLKDSATHGLNEKVVRIDTHGAAVFLAGTHVYKVKRAVRFPFMDLSTRALRRAACEREVEINRVNAPELYLGVVPIVRRNGQLFLGGEGEEIECAVHLQRFDEAMTFDHIVERGELSQGRLFALAAAVAASHARAPRHTGVDQGRELRGVIADCLAGLAETPELFAPAEVAAFGEACTHAIRRCANMLAERMAAGEVRRCHGDLHLRNIVEIDGRVVLFDALEFSERLATIDRLYDLAFVLMDLGVRGLRFEANLLFNRYLAECREGVPETGVAALPLFLALRAAIRAQVTAASLAHLDEAKRARAQQEAQAYFAFAGDALRQVAPRLIAVGGLSGTGKSTLAAGIAPLIGPAPGAVHLRSDVERKRLLDAPEFEKLSSAAYDKVTTDKVYQRLRERAGMILRAGHGVVVDAVHQRPEEREALEKLAKAYGVGFAGLWLEAPVEQLTARVEARRGDASDADARIVRQQAERDLGPLNWERIDSSGEPAAVLARARAVLDDAG